MPVNKSEIESLVYLLDDPDEFVRKSVTDRLFQIGEASVPLLDELRSKTSDQETKTGLLGIIHNLTFSGFQQDFVNYLENGVLNLKDLEKGVFMLSRIDDPTMRTRQYTKLLDQMADELEPEINLSDSPKMKMNVVLHYLYSRHGFEGCHSDYLSPRHSYLHHVIKNRIGIPLSLAFVILFLGRRLGLPFYGVNMPLHFLVKYEAEPGEEVFIDPFNKGGFITKEQCLVFLKKSGIKASETHFKNAGEREMLKRFIRNLINGYQQHDDTLRSEGLLKILALLETSDF